MANANKFVAKNGLRTHNIELVTSSGTRALQLTVLDNGTLSFAGDSGQVFSVTDNLTGTIFAVNDISGIPSIEVDDTGRIRLAETFGNILIGTAVDNGIDKLQLNGSLSLAKTWNNATSIYTGIKCNITDLASNATSLLIDLQVAGASKFKVTKDGNIHIPAQKSVKWGYGSQITESANGSLTVADSAGSAATLSVKSIRFNASSYLSFASANVLQQVNSTNSQTFQLYNTYTDANNYARAQLGWSGNDFFLTTTALGTGTRGNIVLDGTVKFTNPTITVGGSAAPSVDDNKDRGVEFLWHNGTAAKTGFFGFDDSTGKLTFIPDATNTNAVYMGTKGTIDAYMDWADVTNKPDPVITVTLTGDATGSANATLTDLASGTVNIATAVGSLTNASYVQATGRSSTWGSTNGTQTGAVNAIMGTAAQATWLISGTSGGVFRAGIQALDADGTLRFYQGTNQFSFTGGTLTVSSVAATSITANTVTATLVGNVTGSALTLTNARTIGDVSFNGSANIVPERMLYKDTRDVDFAPLSHLGVTLHLKSNGIDGLTDGGVFHGVLNIAHWLNQTGGYEHQLAFTDGGNMYMRQATGLTTWGEWAKFWHTGNAPLVSTIPTISNSLTSVVEHSQLSGIDQYVAGTAFSNGTTTYDAMTTGNAFLWSPSITVNSTDAYITSVSVRVSAPGTGKIVVVDTALRVISDTAVTLSAIGVNTITLSNKILVPAGARAFFQAGSTILRYADPGSGVWSMSTNGYSGVVGDTVSVFTANVVQVAVQFDFETASLPRLVDDVATLQALATGVAASSQGNYRSTGTPTLTWMSDIGIKKFETAYDGGVDIPAGATLTHVSADLIATTGCDRFVFSVFERDTSAGDAALDNSTTAPLRSVAKTPAELGLVLNAASTTYVAVKIDPIVVVEGKSYFILVQALGSAATIVSFGLGEDTTTDTRQRRRGRYSLVSPYTFPSGSLVPSGYKSSIGFEYNWERLTASDASHDERILDASATVAGTGVSVTATFSRNGTTSRIAGSQTLSYAAASNIRYDVIYYDALAGTFGTITGTARTIDPSEMIPALTSPTQIALFNCRVTDATITTVPVWGVADTEIRSLAQTLESERVRSRKRIPLTISKIRRGAALRVLSFGDSIVAHQNTTPSSSTPNGAARDRDFYFLESIGADIVGALTRYTSVQLGRADDGAGAVHLANSYVWEMVKALWATGQSVTYDNFCVGGTNTLSAVDVSLVPTPWLTAAIALSPDVVIINFGMNERGNSATEGRMVAIINHFRSAGIEVIVNGCPRPASGSVADWEYTNRALERAAKFAGAAFVPMLPLYDDRYIGVIGCSSVDASSANRINHPGLNEHRKIGSEYIKLVLG